MVRNKCNAHLTKQLLRTIHESAVCTETTINMKLQAIITFNVKT